MLLCEAGALVYEVGGFVGDMERLVGLGWGSLHYEWSPVFVHETLAIATPRVPRTFFSFWGYRLDIELGVQSHDQEVPAEVL